MKYYTLKYLALIAALILLLSGCSALIKSGDSFDTGSQTLDLWDSGCIVGW